jgi:hypothetical protein
VRVSGGRFSGSVKLDEGWLLLLRSEFPVEILSDAVTICAVLETGRDRGGQSRQPDPSVVQAIGVFGEKLAGSSNVKVFGSLTANPSNWLEVQTSVRLESPVFGQIQSQQRRPLRYGQLQGFCGA